MTRPNFWNSGTTRQLWRSVRSWFGVIFNIEYDVIYWLVYGNVRGPKVVIALRSSVFFWPRSLPSTSSKLLRGDIIWKEIICPLYWYIKYSQGIKGIRVVGVEMGVPNCMQNWESVERWRWYWYRSGETKLLSCTSVPHKHLHFYMCRRYRISNNHIPLTDKTIPNRNNRLKSEMTTLGPTCRLLGFIKMGDFFSLLTLKQRL